MDIAEIRAAIGDVGPRVLPHDFSGTPQEAYAAAQRDTINDILDLLKRLEAKDQ
tara:strand:- start:156 stop:317 length:162 start_codon:yes stop_codon:yes gene_type:complete